MRKDAVSEEIDFNGASLTAKGLFQTKRASGSLVSTFAAVPGETIKCLVGGKKKGAHLTWIQEIINVSPKRMEPPCPHFSVCGGCAFQNLSYEEQLKLKAQPVIDGLYEVASDFELLDTVPAHSPWYYRGKIELSFLKDSLGFNMRGCFDRVVNVHNCYIGPPMNSQIISLVRQWQKENEYIGWDPRNHTGFLRYLIIRRSFYNDQFLVTIVTTAPDDSQTKQLNILGDRLTKLGAHGVIHVTQNSPASAVVVEEQRIVAGSDNLVEQLGELHFDLNWRSFFQANPPSFANMLSLVKPWLDIKPDSRILDLYCGVGTIGLSLNGHLTGVEFVPEAIENAKENAAKNNLEGEFFCGSSESWPDLSCDLLVLDPPRSGCHPKLIKRLAQGPETILYISCNPKRFIEELKELKANYKLNRVQLFDFFPQTPHIEMVSLLSKIHS